MITPYANRVFDLEKSEPVEVYRNVTKKGVTYSIRQGGYVVAHADELYLVNAEFVVRQAGRKRVKKEKRKNVHAWIKGEIATKVGDSKGFQVVYDPKKYRTFVRKTTKKPVRKALSVMLGSEGVWVDNTVNM
jgi:hypothetical protein